MTDPVQLMYTGIIHPWMATVCRGLNKASSSVWRMETACALKRDQLHAALTHTCI